LVSKGIPRKETRKPDEVERQEGRLLLGLRATEWKRKK
jgi:hypothetical protein